MNAVNNSFHQYNVRLGSDSAGFSLVETENQVCFSLLSLPC